MTGVALPCTPAPLLWVSSTREEQRAAPSRVAHNLPACVGRRERLSRTAACVNPTLGSQNIATRSRRLSLSRSHHRTIKRTLSMRDSRSLNGVPVHPQSWEQTLQGRLRRDHGRTVQTEQHHSARAHIAKARLPTGTKIPNSWSESCRILERRNQHSDRDRTGAPGRTCRTRRRPAASST